MNRYPRKLRGVRLHNLCFIDAEEKALQWEYSANCDVADVGIVRYSVDTPEEFDGEFTVVYMIINDTSYEGYLIVAGNNKEDAMNEAIELLRHLHLTGNLRHDKNMKCAIR